MTCTPTGDAEATLGQVQAMAAAGCELVRVSLPAAEDVEAFAQVVAASPAPIIADIHFDWRLALAALEAGAAGVRINPGTISEKYVLEIVQEAGRRKAAVRIGVNGGSLPRELRTRAETDPVGALVEAAVGWTHRFEDWGAGDFKVSVKSSSVTDTIAAYRLLAGRAADGSVVGDALIEAPLHVGVTEAGTVWSGAIKSAVGIGTLLAEGVGDTIRVSLTGDPVAEVRAAWKILAALGLRRRGPDVISCPTCSRTEIDIVGLASEVERRLESDPRLAERPFTVAVMGCRVNGPEEAKHADYGIAAGSGEGVLFDHGERVATVPEDGLLEALFERIEQAVTSGA